MKINRTVRILAFSIAAVTFIALLVWALIAGRREFQTEQERPVKSPSRVSGANGERRIKLSLEEQKSAGILVESLASASHSGQLKAYGSVVPVRELSDLIQKFASAKAQAEKTKALLAASRKDYERVKTLYEKSLTAAGDFQSIEAAFRSNQADSVSAQLSLQSIESSIRQEWGVTISQWIFNSSSEFDRLLRQQDVLLEVNVPPGAIPLSPPQTALIQSASEPSRPLTARFVSLARTANARFQGAALYYKAKAASELLPGMNITAHLPVGKNALGVVVPRSALVWWEGRAWAYYQKDSATFVREEIPTTNPVQEGWFVPGKSGEITESVGIVTRGGQLLLSEEFRSQIQVGEKGENE